MIYLQQLNPGYGCMQIMYYCIGQFIQMKTAYSITKRFEWTNHVDRVVAKANATIGFLKRNPSSCTSTVKKDCYLTMFRPILDYSCTAWSPYTQVNIQRLEMVQHSAARFIPNNYSFQRSITEMLNKLNLPPLL